MNLFSFIFGLAVQARNALYDRGILAARSLTGAVISVGNLSVGGSGKTPFVILLGELLKSRQIKFDVLSRGYGRKTRGVALVDAAGSASEFGDEPLLLARKLNVPVIVGEDRFEAGAFAEHKFGSQVHLLDDGFQHRALSRDFDIVLLTGEDLHDCLLPTGRLREPLTALARANAVVLTCGMQPSALPLDGKLVWHVRRAVELDRVPEAPVVFCGIARPRNFLSQLRAAGIEPVAEALFPDHHAYTEHDIRDLMNLRQKSQGRSFITTEKDVVNLGGYLSSLEPMIVARVKMKLLASGDILETILQHRQQRTRPA
jgi:tetraacyldisaccharide 4'-kinase